MPERQLDLQLTRKKACDEGWPDRRVSAWSDPEEVDHGHLIVVRPSKPAIVRRVRIRAHEGVVDQLRASCDLLVDHALIIVPNSGSGSREHGSDREQMLHRARLEDPTLRIDEGHALTSEDETPGQLLAAENI